PNVMTSQPEFWAFECESRTPATTPHSMRISNAVPTSSGKKTEPELKVRTITSTLLRRQPSTRKRTCALPPVLSGWTCQPDRPLDMNVIRHHRTVAGPTLVDANPFVNFVTPAPQPACRARIGALEMAVRRRLPRSVMVPRCPPPPTTVGTAAVGGTRVREGCDPALGRPAHRALVGARAGSAGHHGARSRKRRSRAGRRGRRALRARRGDGHARRLPGPALEPRDDARVVPRYDRRQAPHLGHARRARVGRAGVGLDRDDHHRARA